jgi:hypothetical protein
MVAPMGESNRDLRVGSSGRDRPKTEIARFEAQFEC